MDKFYRSKYIEGSDTPLLRGILHCLFTVTMLYFIPYVYYMTTLLKFAAYMMILSSYICSSIYHCIRLQYKYELLTRIADHIAIHHHIFAACVGLITNNICCYIAVGIYMANYLLDVKRCLSCYKETNHDYFISRKHILHYVTSMALCTTIVIIDAVTNKNYYSFVMQGIILGIYIIGQLYYCYSLDDNYKPHHIWSNHETFHLFVVAGTIGVLCTLFL